MVSGGSGVSTSQDISGYDASTGEAIYRRVTTDSDGNVTINHFKQDGITPMPISSSFVSSDNVVTSQKFVTDLVTGAYFEVTEQKDLVNNSVKYFDASGAAYTLGANESAGDYVQHVNLGSEVISVTAGTPAILTVPVNAQYAYTNVRTDGAGGIWNTSGDAIDLDADHRVTDGGRITLETAYELAQFQIESLDAEDMKLRVYYSNVDPKNVSLT